MSFFGGGYGGPTHVDPEASFPGDDGTYEPPLKWIAFGIVLPLVLIALSALVVYAGGVCFPDRSGLDVYWLRGRSIVAAAVIALHGASAIFVGRFLLPNVWRNSYVYQYVAGAGIIFCFIGMVWFVIAAMQA